MMNFETAFQKVLEVEGRGYTNIKHDDGGPTKFGITQSTLADFRHKFVTPDDVKNLDEDEAREIYRTLFWNRLQLDKVPSSISYLLFDQAVNFGSVSTAKRIQSILRDVFGMHVVVDGVFGPMSVAAINSVDLKKFLFEFMKKTYLSYAKSVVADPDDLKFLVGWINRANKLLDQVQEIIHE